VTSGRIASLPHRISAKARRSLADNPLTRAVAMRRHRRILTREYITSTAYSDLMMRHYDPSIDGPESAERLTSNFRFRHFEKNRILGAWRWLGALEHRDLIATSVFDEQLGGLDLGGARGPISPAVEICDRLERDVFGRRVRYREIAEIDDGTLDYIWTSHTLEHIPGLEAFLASLSAKLASGGQLFAMVPAWTCQRWRAGVHSYADSAGTSPHLYTFALEGDDGASGMDPVVRIDSVIGRSLRVEAATMAGDNSIFVVARKP